MKMQKGCGKIDCGTFAQQFIRNKDFTMSGFGCVIPNRTLGIAAASEQCLDALRE